MTEPTSDNVEPVPATVPETPSVLPILPLEHFIMFPSMIAPIIVGDERSKRLVDDVLGGQRLVGIFTKRPESENLTEFVNLYTTGTSANILKMLKMPDGTIRLLLHGVQRIRIKSRLGNDPYLRAIIEPVPDIPSEGPEVDALVKNIHTMLAKAIELSSIPEDLRIAAANLTEPGKLADLVASNLALKIPEQQKILEIADVAKRLQRVLYVLNREIEVLELGSKIQTQVKSELDKTQRDFLLREQMKAIRKELGEEDGGHELEELRERIEKKPLPKHAKDAADKELARLRQMQPASAEYTVSRTYLETILELPWLESTTDLLNIRKARRILDNDHYDLDKVKDRIIEYLSVRKLKKDMKGPILCFVGPPGVGKTSLGRSIAQAMGRKFVRMSLGGMRDEAEIRGHRRTYIGAMPGRLLKSLRSAGSNNPVIMLDEIDKLGSDYRGDPAAALLEVLDPEQNNSFTDHYLDLPFDLSHVLFITTANQLDPIPGPLRDRMEMIEVSGYTLRDKMAIAKRYIIPKQMTENGVTTKHIAFTDVTLTRIIEDYTREAGLRNLERQIGTVCRKVARMVAEGRTRIIRVAPGMLEDMLGPSRYYNEVAQRMGSPGVAMGLAWTPVGGEILFIEATMTAGGGRFTLTGQLGDVMKESAQAAFTHLHGEAERLGIPEALFHQRDIHVHVPAGAIPKDGPSAGITMCCAMASLMTGRAVKDFLAMTGEITLKGNVLPVGGIKEKLLAAVRAGVKEIIMPERNRADVGQLPDEIRKKLKIHLADRMAKVLEFALEPKRHKQASKLVDWRPEIERGGSARPRPAAVPEVVPRAARARNGSTSKRTPPRPKRKS